jgi:Fe2+ or Zn2+ uptake regulation protein
VFHGAKKLNLFQANDLIKKLPDIGRASIFRTLSLFVEIGVLRKYTLGTG